MQNWKRIAPGSQKTARSPQRSRVVAILLFDGALASGEHPDRPRPVPFGRFSAWRAGVHSSSRFPVPQTRFSKFPGGDYGRARRRGTWIAVSDGRRPRFWQRLSPFNRLSVFFCHDSLLAIPPKVVGRRFAGRMMRAYTRKYGDSGGSAYRRRAPSGPSPIPRRRANHPSLSASKAHSRAYPSCPPRATEVWRRQRSRFKPNGQPSRKLTASRGRPARRIWAPPSLRCSYRK
jgi:hypothetical protein